MRRSLQEPLELMSMSRRRPANSSSRKLEKGAKRYRDLRRPPTVASERPIDSVGRSYGCLGFSSVGAAARAAPTVKTRRDARIPLRIEAKLAAELWPIHQGLTLYET
jgi:hypothetical protein